MGKVVLSGFMVVPLNQLEEAKSAIARHIELTREEPGCLVFEVDEDLEQPGRFTVYEAFEDQASYDIHQERAKASPWGEVSKDFERHYTMTDE